LYLLVFNAEIVKQKQEGAVWIRCE
jgi:hypothetical protein